MGVEASNLASGWMSGAILEEAGFECDAEDLMALADGAGFGLDAVVFEGRGLGLWAESDAICLRGGTTGALTFLGKARSEDTLLSLSPRVEREALLPSRNCEAVLASNSTAAFESACSAALVSLASEESHAPDDSPVFSAEAEPTAAQVEAEISTG